MNNTQDLLPVKTLLKSSWQILRSQSRTLYGIYAVAAIIWIPITVLVLGGLASGHYVGGETASYITVGAIAIVALAVALVLSVWIQVALMEAVIHGYAFKQAFRQARPKIWAYFRTGFLVALICAVGFVLLIVPGIIFAIWYSFAGMVVVAEGKTGWAALKQSKMYIKGRVGAVLWRLVAPGIIIWICAAALQITVNILFSKTGGDIVKNIITFIIAPYFLVYEYLLYKNLKETMQPAPVELASTPAATI